MAGMLFELHRGNEMQLAVDEARWKDRFPNAGVDPGKAYEALETIRKNNGGSLTDDLIIEAARGKRHTLHKLFEWDDTKAAHEHRRSQARSMIRALIVPRKDKPAESIRAYEVVEKHRKTDDKTERTLYSTHEEAMSDPSARERLILEAIAQLRAWRRRFAMLTEFDDLAKAIDAKIDEMVDV